MGATHFVCLCLFFFGRYLRAENFEAYSGYEPIGSENAKNWPQASSTRDFISEAIDLSSWMQPPIHRIRIQAWRFRSFAVG